MGSSRRFGILFQELKLNDEFTLFGDVISLSGKLNGAGFGRKVTSKNFAISRTGIEELEKFCILLSNL